MAKVILWVKRIVLILLVVFLVMLGIWFSADNTQGVRVILLGFDMPEMTLGVVIALALTFGVLLGFLASIFPIINLRARQLRLQRKLLAAEKELERLRKKPLVKS